MDRAKTQPSEQTPLPSRLLLWGRSALRGVGKIAPAGVAPVARAQVVRGAVARRSGYGFPLDSSQENPPPPAASFAVQTRPPCALLPLIASAAPGRPCAPVPPFVLLSPVLPRQASGWQPLRRGGSVGPTLRLRRIVLGATPTPALSVFLTHL